MKLDDQRQIRNFRDGCIKDLKETLSDYYNIKIEDDGYLEDFVNEIGEICSLILYCNQALHYKRDELEIEVEKEFLKLYE